MFMPVKVIDVLVQRELKTHHLNGLEVLFSYLLMQPLKGACLLHENGSTKPLTGIHLCGFDSTEGLKPVIGRTRH